MDGREDDAGRWAPPGHPAAGQPRGDADRDEPQHSAAAPWTRGRDRRGRPEGASVGSSDIEPPVPPWEPPLGIAEEERRERSMLPIAIGIALLAALACVPHWVAPTITLMVSLTGLPIAWGFRRISHGRRRVQYIVVVLTLLLIAVLSVIAPMTWLELGVLQPLTVPDVPAP